MSRSRILIPMVAALALFASACSDDDETFSPTPTTAPASPTVTAGSPQAGQCPVAAELCTFAATVMRNLQADLNQVMSLAQFRDFTCPATRPQGLGGPYPLCDETPGQTRQGISIAYLASEGVVVDAAGLRDALARWVQQGAQSSGSDRYGPAANKLYTIGCAAGPLPCGNQFVLAFSQQQANVPVRTNLMLYFERTQAGAQPRLTFVVFGPLLEPAAEQAALAGGAASNFLAPQGWPPIATFYKLP